MIQFLPVTGIPEVQPGADIAALILNALRQSDWIVHPADVVVIAQKIISKAEGQIVPLATVTPSQRAVEIAGRCMKDPRLVELVLRESDEVARCAPHVLIVRHRLGFIVANAAIDQSNWSRAMTMRCCCRSIPMRRRRGSAKQ